MRFGNNITYFELVYNLGYGLILPECKFRVKNSGDNRIYTFIEGDCISIDSKPVRFEDIYRNCDLYNIELELLNDVYINTNNLKYDKNKYCNKDEFFNKKSNFNSDKLLDIVANIQSNLMETYDILNKIKKF